MAGGAVGIGALVALGVAAPAAAAPTQAARGQAHVRVCPAPPHGYASCNAIRNDAKPAAAVTPSGYGPADLQSAYDLPSSSAGAGQTIAIVDAYDAPSAEADLGVYRSTYGLPPCTTANRCFKKVNQSGTTKKLPRADGGWAQEISLDLDMASAICPNCKILLVEASSASYANLGTAVNTAVAMGATVVSNSYGGPSSSSDPSYDGYYNHKGVAITVSTGDSGYGVQYPAASQYVTAVGGTSLVRDGSASRGWAEKAWSGAGSGCSTGDLQPTWQAAAVGGACAKRAVADVSAIADPSTGVAVYDSYAYQGRSGWMVFGGTSVAAPVVAGVYALAGNAASTAYPAKLAYDDPTALNDVVGGTTGTCTVTALCTAVAGWDGPTGLGTPNGVAGF